MSGKLGSMAPSPSITNPNAKSNSRPSNSGNNSNSNNNNNNNNSNSNTHIDNEDEESGDNEEDDEDAGIIRCICNYTDDDGFTIQCERCFVWQHAVCVGIVQSNVPDEYLCELCSPRPVDRKRANEIQRRGNIERKKEKSPSRRKPSVGRPRKQFGHSEQSPTPTSSSLNTKENGLHHNPVINGPANGYQGKSSSGLVDVNGKKVKSTGTTNNSSKPSPQYPQSQTPTPTTSSSQPYHSTQKNKSSGQGNGSRISSSAIEEDDVDMESDSQDEVQDSYQSEFSPVETNIVASKAVQELFRQVIAQFRQAQSRKRSLSLTSSVKLELVASNPCGSGGNNSNNNNNSNVTTLSNFDGMDTSSNSQSSLATSSAHPNADPLNVVSMERESLARPLMKTAVKHVLSSSKLSHSPASQYGLFAESNISAGRFMMEFKGEVSLKSLYMADPINQYSILAAPKPFVLFHPQLNLVVDARRSGNDARFVRRSCVPNTEVKSIVVPGVQDQTVHLGLFAKVPIGKGQEITLDWDWNTEHLAFQPIKSLQEKPKDGSNKKAIKDIRKAKHQVASTLLAQTDCACEDKDSCVLHQMLKDGMSEPATRDQESNLSSKGSRPKKTAESLRQRYGSQRERSEGKRSADQDTSDDDLSIAGSSPRRKSPKAPKLESTPKKPRHDPIPNQRNNRVEKDADSESESDDNRRRKHTTSDRHGSPSKRSNSNNSEMSAREMKQALMLIKKMEDRDATTPSHSKQKSFDSKAGITSPKPRSRDKTRHTESDQKLGVLSSKLNTIEDDNISIEDSGIDSDSNNGRSRRDGSSTAPRSKRPQGTQSQGKRERENAENDTQSQSPESSDSDQKDPSKKPSRRLPSSQSGKKQPYAAASRGKRIADLPKFKTSTAGQPLLNINNHDDQHLSGASSVEGSFVSIVGNTSDEEDNTSENPPRKIQRDKNLPKEVITAISPRPSILPCKKFWKLTYMKQRALADKEAREKAEEIRKKAEEVFDLKMEEDETSINIAEANSASEVSNSAIQPSNMEVSKESSPFAPEITKNDSSTDGKEPSMVEGDVLNLFHENVKPESRSTNTDGPQQHKTLDKHAESNAQLRESIQPAVMNPTVAYTKEPRSDLPGPNIDERSQTPQKLSLESYQARRNALPTPSNEQSNFTKSLEKAQEHADVEMKDVNTLDDQKPIMPIAIEAPGLVEESSELKPESEPAIPKVKLSLQEYQKQRQEASQRNAGTASIEVPRHLKVEDTNGEKQRDIQGHDMNAKAKPDHEPMDVDIDEKKPGPLDVTKLDKTRGDYFQVGTSVPTPLIGLSSRAQGTKDYFPVQPSSPISLSAGPTSFSKLNLTSSPPRTHSPSDALGSSTGSNIGSRSPGKVPVMHRPPATLSPNEPSRNTIDASNFGKTGSPPHSHNQPSTGWRTPRTQRAQTPPAPSHLGGGAGGAFRNNSSDFRAMDSRSADSRLASPRYYGSPSDRSDKLPLGALNSPTKERQHSLTPGGNPTSPFDAGYPNVGGHYGYNDDTSQYKRPGHLSSPTGPAGPNTRDHYKDDRTRYRSMNGDDWGYGGIDSPAYGSHRGPRAPPLSRDRDRERERDRDHERDRERDRGRRDRFDGRNNEYFGQFGNGAGVNSFNNNNNGFYGPNRGQGGYGRRPSDYYGGQGRDDGHKKEGPSDNQPLSF
ncbi:hypothetical protein BGZ76_006575 [Entomortierella beljakovae]|nr:hypothetical protein BGZ76_006575 [Entomortierella beljakovae]